MRIRRIAIENFRKLAAPLCLDDLGEGLTVIGGDNEDGKSTVVEAVRAALFCRHRATGTQVDGFAPFDCSGARPRVELDFTINGSTYRLTKSFCRRPYEAVLAAPGQRYEGDAAEDELARLLGFTPASRGVLPAEDQGVWGLFWIEQGRSFDPGLRVGDAGRATLTRALEDEVGRVLGGDSARVLMERIRQHCDALFSPGARSVPRGELKQCIERAAKVGARLAKLEARLAAFNAQVEDLERLRQERLQIEPERTLAAAEARLQEAEAEQVAIAEARAQLEKARGQSELAKARLDAARAPWRQRKNAAETAIRLREAAAALHERRVVAAAAHAPLRECLVSAEAGLQDAQARLATAEGCCVGAEQALRRARMLHDLRAAACTLTRAEAAAKAVAAAEEEAGRDAVDDAAILRLRGYAAAAAEARMRLDAAETVVEVAPEPGRRVFAGAQEIAGAAPLRLAAPVTLRLEGFGTITIKPGGADLDARQQAAAAADQALAGCLHTLGMGDLAAAEVAHARRREALARAEAERRALDTAAPAGVSALRDSMREHERALERLPANGASPASETASLQDLQSALEVAIAEREAAHLQVKTAKQRYEACSAEAVRAERDIIALQTQAAAATEEERAHADALAQERACVADATLLTLLKDAQDDVDAAGHRLAVAEAALLRLDADAAKARLAAARQALVDVEARVTTLDAAIRDLQSDLRAGGHCGLEQELAAARAEHACAQQEHAAVARRAAALKLLHDTLRDAEAQARSQFEGPIAERMAPYLEALFPGSTLVFARDTLQLRSFRRNGVEEPFDRLSVGTREQLAVLMRLAFAELLAKRGQPAAVILDDALVYADRVRLVRMQEILLRAARRVQVIVLTCRADDYAALAARGVPIRRLAECQQAGRSPPDYPMAETGVADRALATCR